METKYLNIYALYLFKWASAIEVSGSLKKIVMYRLNSVTKELFHVSFCLSTIISLLIHLRTYVITVL